MSRPAKPIMPPRDCEPWLYEILRSLSEGTTKAAAGLASITRGEQPDGSGLPLGGFDGTLYFYLPGRTPVQTAYPSSTGQFIRMQTRDFSVLNCTTSNGSPTVSTTDSFAPTGGPRVVPGMLIDGPGIPSGTIVAFLTSGLSLTMSANAGTGAGTGTCTFRTYVDLTSISDETGRDIQFDLKGAVRFSTGTSATAPLRIMTDSQAIASGLASSDRMYMEVGTISSGSAVGTNLQIGGPGHGDLQNLIIRSSNIYIDEPNSGFNPQVGIGQNPAEAGSGTGFNVQLFIKHSSTYGLLVQNSSTSTNTPFMIFNTVSGSSPTKSIDTTTYIFKVGGDSKVYFGNGANGGFYAQGTTSAATITNIGTDLTMLAFTIGTAAWSDSAVSSSLFLGATTGTSAKRTFVSTSGNGVFDRIGFSSKYTLVTNAQAANADFLAPSTAPEVLQIVNSSSANGDNGAVLLKIRTRRSGQTANLTEWLSSTDGVMSSVTPTGAWAGDTTLVSIDDDLVLYDDDTVFI